MEGSVARGSVKVGMGMEDIDEIFFLKVSVLCEWVMVVDCGVQAPTGV